MFHFLHPAVLDSLLRPIDKKTIYSATEQHLTPPCNKCVYKFVSHILTYPYLHAPVEYMPLTYQVYSTYNQPCEPSDLKVRVLNHLEQHLYLSSLSVEKIGVNYAKPELHFHDPEMQRLFYLGRLHNLDEDSFPESYLLTKRESKIYLFLSGFFASFYRVVSRLIKLKGGKAKHYENRNEPEKMFNNILEKIRR